MYLCFALYIYIYTYIGLYRYHEILSGRVYKVNQFFKSRPLLFIWCVQDAKGTKSSNLGIVCKWKLKNCCVIKILEFLRKQFGRQKFFNKLLQKRNFLQMLHCTNSFHRQFCRKKFSALKFIENIYVVEVAKTFKKSFCWSLTQNYIEVDNYSIYFGFL